MRASAAIGWILVMALPAAAEDPPLLCFGNEPSWSLALEEPDRARLMLPDEPPLEYRGTDARLPHLRERAWRGGPSAGPGAELVVFLREAACSDGMSDDTHSVVARVSLPDGRFLAGCCRIVARAPAADAPSAPTRGLEGPVWRLTELRGQDPEALAAVSPGVTVRFEGGQLQAFGGCNRLAGSYTLEGDRLSVGPLAGTLMACPEPQTAVESALRSALTGVLRLSIAGERLSLAPEDDADPSLAFEMAPPPRLEGITWEVTGFNNGRQAVVSPVIGTTLSVLFQDGSVTGHAGCNTFRASYTREGDRLAIAPAAATRRHCEGEGVMEQERQFLSALETATSWAIDRDMLDLHRPDGERVLLARPVPN